MYEEAVNCVASELGFCRFHFLCVIQVLDRQLTAMIATIFREESVINSMILITCRANEQPLTATFEADTAN